MSARQYPRQPAISSHIYSMRSSFLSPLIISVLFHRLCAFVSVSLDEILTVVTCIST